MTAPTATHKSGALQGFVDDLNGAIRENPLAAGLIGAGVLWMFFGGGRISGVASALPGAARNMAGAVGAAAQATGGAVGDAVAGTGARIGDAARQAGDAISTGATQAAKIIRDTATAGYDALSSAGEQAAGQASRTGKDADRAAGNAGWDLGPLQVNLKQTLERQPLMLGLIGIAIGAAIASAFPSTDLEREVMGEAGATVKDKIQEIATGTTEFVSDRAKQVVSDVKQEVAAQGLTPAAAMEGLKDVAEKVKNVAGASREAIKGRLS
jgi:hypothetical protein